MRPQSVHVMMDQSGGATVQVQLPGMRAGNCVTFRKTEPAYQIAYRGLLEYSKMLAVIGGMGHNKPRD